MAPTASHPWVAIPWPAGGRLGWHRCEAIQPITDLVRCSGIVASSLESLFSGTRHFGTGRYSRRGATHSDTNGSGQVPRGAYERPALASSRYGRTRLLLTAPHRSALRPSFPAWPIFSRAIRHCGASRALPTARPTMASADFCRVFGAPYGSPGHDSVTHGRPPKVSSTAFDARPPDLRSAPLLDTDFAVSCRLVPRLRLRSHSCPSARASAPSSFRRRLATARVRFTRPLPPSGWVEDLHLLTVNHACHTTMTAAHPTGTARPSCASLDKASGAREHAALRRARPGPITD